MAVSVVVSQVVPSDDISVLRLKGTVGGVPFTTGLRNFRFDPTSMPANTLATLMLSRFNTIVNLMTSGTLGLNGRTVNLTVQDARKSVVTFGATPYTFLDYDSLEITGTVDGVPTKVHISQENFMEQTSLAQDMGIWVAQQLYNQYLRVSQQLTPFINTFSI